MQADDTAEDEVHSCLEHGELEIKQQVQGEMRYGKKLELKNKTILVIYIHRGEVQRVITCYLIRRKKLWQNQ